METIWAFETAKFKVEFCAEPDSDLDLSWDDTGEVARNLDSGLWCAFAACVRVKYQGSVIAIDYLGGCIHKDPSDFIGDSYFRDMVRSVCRDAREYLCDTPNMRCP